jgi:hypothetical protein
LGLELGIWDIASWRRQITLEQLAQWMAYWRVEPFGGDWRRTGRAALAMAGGRVDASAEDKFLPSYRERPPTEDEVIAQLKSIPTFRKQLEQQGR